MTQKSFFEGRSAGGKRTISLAAIVATKDVQYSPENVKLKSLLRINGFLNNITVLNNDEVNVELQLDYNINKTYFIPAKSSISLSEVHYEGFNIVNLDTAVNSIVDKIIVSVGYEAPVLREKGGSR